MKKLLLSMLFLIGIHTTQAQCVSNTILTGTTTGIQNVESPDTIKATNNVTSSGNAIYHAGNSILFQPSFVAISGCKLHAYIAGCNGIFNARQAQTILTNEEIKVKSEIIKVSPNPNNGIFKIKINEVSEGTIVVTDLYGFTVFKSEIKNQYEFEMNLQDNPKGIYIVKVVSGDQTYTSKIIKN